MFTIYAAQTHLTMPIKFFTDTLQRVFRTRHRELSEQNTTITSQWSHGRSYLEDEKRIYLDTTSWFWGDLSNRQAEYLLRDAEDGVFVVCNSSEKGFLYCITYKLGQKVGTLRVFERDGQLSLNFDDPMQVRAATIHGLIAKLLNASIKHGSVCKLERSSRAVPLKLNSPVNRISSLRAHCRRVIRMTSANETISDLALPRHLKSFLLGY